MKAILLGAICFFMLFTAFTSWGQDRFTMSGYIKDASNGEALIGATAFVNEISNGTISNAYGFYSITLPKGNYHLDFRYIGYNDTRVVVALNKDTRLDIELGTSEEQLEEVVVIGTAIDENVQQMEMSTAKLDIKTIEKIPAFAGEVDIIKGIQMLPGVSTVGEGASGFNVRGGTVGQNLILLDEAPVYQSSHLFGFFLCVQPRCGERCKTLQRGCAGKVWWPLVFHS